MAGVGPIAKPEVIGAEAPRRRLLWLLPTLPLLLRRSLGSGVCPDCQDLVRILQLEDGARVGGGDDVLLQDLVGLLGQPLVVRCLGVRQHCPDGGGEGVQEDSPFHSFVLGTR